MHVVRVCCFFVLSLMIFEPCLAADNFYNKIGLEAGYMWGDTTYEINFPGGKSELKWPIDIYMAGIRYYLDYKDRFGIELAYFKGPERNNIEYMEDSDWMEEPIHPGVDIYSESKVDNKGDIFCLGAWVSPLSFESSSIGIRWGYRNQGFEYDAYDTIQVGYGPWEERYSGVTPGLVCKYKVDYSIWYLGVSGKITLRDMLTFDGDIIYLGHVRAEDEDYHLLRYKKSEGDCNGNGVLLSVDMSLILRKGWSIFFYSELTRIRTDGDQTQSWYGNDPASQGYDDTGAVFYGIDNKIDLDSKYLGIGIQYKF
ncbi:MAG: omptin family outer membrane protease [Deltaproteobacteria bacterium]|nr:omptin family outer membrane protease [Deltaproteobacteria bacterium]